MTSASISKKEVDFHNIFDLKDEKLLDDFTCACQTGTDLVAHHGRMYITYNYICFYSHIIGSYSKIIVISDITQLNKRNTAFVVPNALEIVTEKEKFCFTSFIFRDRTYELILTLWKKCRSPSLSRKEKRKSISIESKPPTLSGINLVQEQGEELSDACRKANSRSVTPQKSPVRLREMKDDIDLPSPNTETKFAITGSLPRLSHSTADLRELAQLAGGPQSATPHTAAPTAAAARQDGGASPLPPPVARRGVTPLDAVHAARVLSSPAVRTAGGARQQSERSADERAGSVERECGKRRDTADGEGAGEGPDPENDRTGGEEAGEGKENQPKNKPQVDAEEWREMRVRGMSRAEAPNISFARKKANQRQQSRKIFMSSGYDPQHVGDIYVLSAAKASKGPPANPPRTATRKRNTQRTFEESKDTATPIQLASGADQPASSARVARKRPARKRVLSVKKELFPPISQSCSHMLKATKDAFQSLKTTFSLSVAGFYKLFLDEKLRFFPAIHEEGGEFGYSEMTCTPWALESGSCCLRRDLKYRMPLNITFGPKSTMVEQSHRIHFVNSQKLVLQTISLSKDVPYGDAFQVVNTYTVAACPSGCDLEVQSDVQFLKSVFVRGMIFKSGTENAKKYFVQWGDIAKKFESKHGGPEYNLPYEETFVSKAANEKEEEEEEQEEEEEKEEPVLVASITAPPAQMAGTAEPPSDKASVLWYIALGLLVFIAVCVGYQALFGGVAYVTNPAVEHKIEFVQEFLRLSMKDPKGTGTGAASLDDLWQRYWAEKGKLLAEVAGLRRDVASAASTLASVEARLSGMVAHWPPPDVVVVRAPAASWLLFGWTTVSYGAVLAALAAGLYFLASHLGWI
eukprot:CAMPEP_0177633414 /NCGR_PEP_ID=MMETSP0447-20121125/2825_1 /TAXON_ID=0 /ORGANISM="Stygamoeba regulata, Strain BSH-02190019" /LENGTH=862 /DNA_ID=CAMNT_0019135073 /DNA_START=346 /DNA_END=2934 /DNA_ORIENTATION=-